MPVYYMHNQRLLPTHAVLIINLLYFMPFLTKQEPLCILSTRSGACSSAADTSQTCLCPVDCETNDRQNDEEDDDDCEDDEVALHRVGLSGECLMLLSRCLDCWALMK